MRCTFSEQAERDLEEIGDYIARDNPVRAESYVDELMDFCLHLAQPPEFRRVIVTLKGRGLRRALFGNYQIYYFTLADRWVWVAHIRHGARRKPNFDAPEFTGP